MDFDNKSVTLRWSKPKDTGGRPISHYIIQKKDKFGGWFDALITDDDNCVATIEELEARVPGLSEGKWYQFRVIAVNKAGESDPSPHTRPHLCRHKNRKFLQIWYNSLQDYETFFLMFQSHLQSIKDKLAQRQCAPTGQLYGKSNAEEVRMYDFLRGF